MRIDPVSLRLFVAVVDTGAISRAAELEHIAPSAVSKRLSELEDQLQAQLIERSNRGIRPTAAGQDLLVLARKILYELDSLPGELRGHARGSRGLVRVYANASAIHQFLPAALASFRRKHPGVQLTVQARQGREVQKGVASNEADVGIFTGDSIPEGLQSFPFLCDEIVVAVPDAHPLAVKAELALDDILAYEFVGLAPGSEISDRLVRAAQARGRTLLCSVQVPNFDVMGVMVGAGNGIAIMPRAVAHRTARIDGLRVIPLAEPWARREFRVCVRDLGTAAAAVRVFVEHMQDIAAD